MTYSPAHAAHDNDEIQTLRRRHEDTVWDARDTVLTLSLQLRAIPDMDVEWWETYRQWADAVDRLTLAIRDAAEAGWDL